MTAGSSEPGLESTSQQVEEGLDHAHAAALLARGEIEVLGLLPYSTNYVFLALVAAELPRAGPQKILAVYKPRRGERPLWDFPSGTLATREVAAFELSEAAGWGFVPPTVLRADAPLGEGSLQLFVDHDPDKHYFTLLEERVERVGSDEALELFASFAAFDAVVNNADRKAGHILEDERGKLWAVDHGLAFHAQPKLRTVIWELAGRALSEEVAATLEKLRTELADENGFGGRLGELLSPLESAATLRRTHELLKAGVFPHPTDERHLPWPLV